MNDEARTAGSPSAAQWQAWSADWTAGAAEGTAAAAGLDRAATAEDPRAWLRRLVALRRRRLLVAVAAEGALLGALLALTIFVLGGGARPWQVVWLATLWAFAALAAAFAWWNRRGTWRTAGDSVEHHLHLARLRCERQLRTVRFAILFLAAEVAAVAAQLAWFDRLGWAAAGTLAAVTAAIVTWCLLVRRRTRQELARLQAFSAEVRAAGDGDDARHPASR